MSPSDIRTHIEVASEIKTVEEVLTVAQRFIATSRQKSSDSASLTQDLMQTNELQQLTGWRRGSVHDPVDLVSRGSWHERRQLRRCPKPAILLVGVN